jgi:hypothetical protein
MSSSISSFSLASKEKTTQKKNFIVSSISLISFSSTYLMFRNVFLLMFCGQQSLQIKASQYTAALLIHNIMCP